MFRITLALVVSFAQAAGQQSLPNRINEPIASATVVSEAPVIDGDLGESSWQNAQLLSGFVQREPMEGEPVSERTEVRILYDGEALYVGAWLFDRDPSGIVVGRTLRDASLNDT
ncbi:MAG: hydrolase, partial [Gemmatimonadetes bacterium]|nr:hydrolase [Gemmatimonadota bacterium]